MESTRRVMIRTDDQRHLILPASYLAASHLEHGYALTAHTLQGTTLASALVVSRPDDHDQQWTYTASSRARNATHHTLIESAAADKRDTLAHTLAAMSREPDDDLATEHRPAMPTVDPELTRLDGQLELIGRPAPSRDVGLEMGL
jgi:hypothetical protein